MNRFTEGPSVWDRFPNIYKYQYKYFHPNPILPIVAPGGASRMCLKHYIEADNRNTRWAWDKSPHGGSSALQNELKTIQDSSVRAILPWRGSAHCNCGKATNFTNLGACSDNKLQTWANLEGHVTRTNPWQGESFSVRDWNWNTHELCSGAASIHNIVAVLQDQAVKSVQKIGQEQLRRSMDTVQDLSSRIHEIRQWTDSEREELKLNMVQAQDLQELKQRISAVLKDVEKPLEMSKENLITRRTRQGVEMVHDSVEMSLLNEVDVFQKRLEILRAEMDKVNDQLSRLRNARHEIEVDIGKKVQARDTDQSVQALSTGSPEVGPVDIPRHHAIHSSPTSWVQYTQTVVQRSQNERKLAQMLTIEVMKALLAAAADSLNAWHSTNSAFKSRIAEILGAKTQLEAHIRQLDGDITTLRRHIEEVKEALLAKGPVLQLAQSRLDKRKERPGYELCRDQAMMSLLQEIHVLRNGIDHLKWKKLEMDRALEHLVQTKSTMERDLNLKRMALLVDQEKCLNFRISNPMSTFSELQQQTGKSYEIDPGNQVLTRMNKFQWN